MSKEQSETNLRLIEPSRHSYLRFEFLLLQGRGASAFGGIFHPHDELIPINLAIIIKVRPRGGGLDDKDKVVLLNSCRQHSQNDGKLAWQPYLSISSRTICAV